MSCVRLARAMELNQGIEVPYRMMAAPAFPGLYVGNLTWWTTDQDVINAINSVGINDVQEVKFFEDRNNGQSKGFCVVTFSSETSLPTVIEKLPKLELYGQNPAVTPYSRQNLNLFESQTKTRPQINSINGPNSLAAGIMGISSIAGVHAGTQGLPYSGLNSYDPTTGAGVTGPRTPSYHTGMRLQMRAPRPVGMRGPIPGTMNNGPMIPGGHTMNRLRYMQPQLWNNSQGAGAYNPATMHREERPPRKEEGRSSSSRRGDDTGPSSRRRDDVGSSSRRGDDSGSSSRRGDDVGSSLRRGDDIGSLSRRGDDPGSSSKREERSSRREERSSRREEKSSRREEKSSRREKSHRSDDRRSRSRDRSRERSKEKRDRKDRRDRH